MEETKFDFEHAEAEAILVIGEKIVQRHTSLGPASPLSNMVVADLNSRVSSARQKHDEAMKYKKLMEDALNDRDHFLSTKDKAVKFTLMAIGSILKKENVNLNDWGF